MKKFFVFFLVLITQFSFASNNQKTLSDRAEVSIITCGTGNELYSVFGHTAIRVYDPFEGIDRVYNYGMFDFETTNFYGKFIKGDLLYFADYSNYENFIRAYYYENRSVVEQVLNLTTAQKQKIWDELNASLEEKNKFYIYKFIDQNCTTKVVDIVNSAIEYPINVDVQGNRGTYRQILNTYLNDRYFEKLGINLIFGNKVDQKNDLLFLPDKFEEGLRETTINNQPLVKQEVKVFIPQVEDNFVWWNTYVFAIFVTLLLALGCLTKTGRTIFFITSSVFGLFFLGVGFYSLHSEVLYNNVVLLFNPLLALIPFIRRRLNNYLFLGFSSALLFYVFLNMTSEKLLVTLPLVLLSAFALLMEYRSVNKSK